MGFSSPSVSSENPAPSSKILPLPGEEAALFKVGSGGHQSSYVAFARMDGDEATVFLRTMAEVQPLLSKSFLSCPFSGTLSRKKRAFLLEFFVYLFSSAAIRISGWLVSLWDLQGRNAENSPSGP